MKSTATFLILSLMLLGLGACSSTSTPALEEQEKAVKETIAASMQTPERQKTPTPPSLDESLLNELIVPGMSLELQSMKRFDISVDQAPARAFFMSLVRDTPVNMMVHPEVSGQVSLDLKQVTVEEVMQLVREVYGYEYSYGVSGYVVLPARLQSRIFHVNYLNIARGGESNMSVSSGQILQSSSGSSDDDSASNTDSSTSSSIVTETRTDFWNGLASTVKTIVGTGAERSVVVDPQAGLVIVRAMPSELRDVDNYLQSAQQNLQRQVILEAKIIEVSLNDEFQSGIDWAGLTSGTNQIFAGQAGVINGAPAVLNAENGDFDAANLLASGSNTPFSNIFTVAGQASGFAAIIRLLNNQGEANVLSSPRVATVNNQKAVIKVGSDEFFVTEVSTSTNSTTSTTTTTPNITLTPFFSGIALDVTPQISANDEVILHIHPSVSEINDQTKNITVAGQTQSLPLAFSTVRESDSVVRAKNGQVVVIGGLMQNASNDNDASVPFLGDIPLLGNLFGQKSKVRTRSELVILLKPIVVSGNDSWQNYIQESRERILRLNEERKAEEELGKDSEAVKVTADE